MHFLWRCQPFCRKKLRIIKEKEKSHADGDFYKQRTERTPCKCFTCGFIYHLIATCLKLPKDNKKRKNQVHFNERGVCVSQKESDNSDDDNDQKIYASMARISGNEKCSSRYFGDSLQLTNWILDSGATCHMTTQVSDFIPGSL